MNRHSQNKHFTILDILYTPNANTGSVDKVSNSLDLLLSISSSKD